MASDIFLLAKRFFGGCSFIKPSAIVYCARIAVMTLFTTFMFYGFGRMASSIMVNIDSFSVGHHRQIGKEDTITATEKLLIYDHKAKKAMVPKRPPLPSASYLRRKRPPFPTSSTDTILADVLYYARIPKTGSENFAFLLSKLAKHNRFTHTRYGQPEPRKLTHRQQAASVYNLLTSPDRPIAHDRHVYFIDFRNFTNGQPIWFSVVRDPIDKFVSRFHYHRRSRGALYAKFIKANASSTFGMTKGEWLNKNIVQCIMEGIDPECTYVNGSIKDLSIPYFCGHHSDCGRMGSKWALQEAKKNIEAWFPVVGVLENIKMTLRVLEAKIPQFFHGLTSLYYNELGEPHRNRGHKYPKLPPEAAEKLRQSFLLEYDLYNFVKKRLKQQHIQVLKEAKGQDKDYHML